MVATNPVRLTVTVLSLILRLIQSLLSTIAKFWIILQIPFLPQGIYIILRNIFKYTSYYYRTTCFSIMKMINTKCSPHRYIGLICIKHC